MDKSESDTREYYALQVDFGYTQQDLDHIAQLPPTPPPAAYYQAGDRCGCPHCKSEGWHADSPLCRFWRNYCALCEGSRHAWGDPCAYCREAWREEVAWFGFAVAHPDTAAQVLRGKADAERDNVQPAPVIIVADIADDAVKLFERAAEDDDLARRLQRKLDRVDEMALQLSGGAAALADRIRHLRETASAYRARGFQQLYTYGPTATPNQT